MGGKEKYKAQAGTIWENVTHSRNGTQSGGKEKYNTQAYTVWDNVTHSRNGTKSGGKGKIKIIGLIESLV